MFCYHKYYILFCNTPLYVPNYFTSIKELLTYLLQKPIKMLSFSLHNSTKMLPFLLPKSPLKCTARDPLLPDQTRESSPYPYAPPGSPWYMEGRRMDERATRPWERAAMAFLQFPPYRFFSRIYRTWGSVEREGRAAIESFSHLFQKSLIKVKVKY